MLGKISLLNRVNFLKIKEYSLDHHQKCSIKEQWSNYARDTAFSVPQKGGRSTHLQMILMSQHRERVSDTLYVQLVPAGSPDGRYSQCHGTEDGVPVRTFGREGPVHL